MAFRSPWFALAILAATVAGCATTPGALFPAAQGSVRFNRIELTRTVAPRTLGLPFNGSIGDVIALRSSLKWVDKQRTAALLSGEFESAAVWNHLHAKLAAIRVSVNVGTADSVRQLQANHGHGFSLAPGALVVLREGVGMGAGGIATFDSVLPPVLQGLRIEVADASRSGGFVEALRIINQTLEKANEAIKPGSTKGAGTGAGSGIYSGQVATTIGLAQIPRDVPFALSNGAVLVRREGPDGSSFAFYNPGPTAADIPLEDLAYVPPPPPFSHLRQDAAPIMTNMADAIWDYYVSTSRKQAFVRPPAHSFPDCMFGDGPCFGPDGRITRDEHRRDQVERLLAQRNNPFTVAARISQRIHGFAGAKACGNVNKAYYDWVEHGRRADEKPDDAVGWVDVVARVKLSGPYSANAGITCFDSHLNARYVQNYFLGEDGEPIRTAISLLTDQRVAGQLRNVDDRNEAAGDLLSVVPVVGNAISGFRCVEPDAGARARIMAKITDPAVAVSRPFVQYLYDVSTMERSDLFGKTATQYLDCAAAVPLLGNAVKGSATAARGLNAAWKVGGSARFVKMSQALDRAARTAEGVADLERLAQANGTALGQAASLALKAQRQAQTADNLSDFASGLETVADIGSGGA